jgi:hypothetical protein
MATVSGVAGRVSASAAQQIAAANGGRVGAFVARTAQGHGQRCTWELVALTAQSGPQRAAVAWVVAEALMKQRCGKTVKAFNLWRQATLAGTKLAGPERQLVAAFAEPVFNPALASDTYHGVAGHVGEWLWYLLALESPDIPARVKEYLAVPKDTVSDSGGDGLIIFRATTGIGPMLMFRLWELKKYTGADNSISGTVTGAFKQLSEHGARYVVSQLAWAEKNVSGDVGDFVSQLVELWISGHPASGAGVSVAANATAVPKSRAFTTVHNHVPHLIHPGQLEGLVISIDDFEGFAAHVQELVWTAL